MDVHILGWIGLAIVVIALITTDIVGHVRKPHAPSMKEATAWTLGYVALAAAFGVAIWAIYGPSFAIQFYSGYIMEWSLSLDNLFVFVIIMSSFRVPREFQQNGFVRFVRRIFPVTDGYIGDRFFYRHSGRTSVTPLFLVVLALGSADLMFALDSIPAILGLTTESYLVFACNAFALLGLRQLFFLIDGLLEKLVFLNYGLAVILGFIGIKLVLHAMHENSVPFINGGQPIHSVPEIGIPISLGVIATTLIVTVITSLIHSRRHKTRS